MGRRTSVRRSWTASRGRWLRGRWRECGRECGRVCGGPGGGALQSLRRSELLEFPAAIPLLSGFKFHWTFFKCIFISELIIESCLMYLTWNKKLVSSNVFLLGHGNINFSIMWVKYIMIKVGASSCVLSFNSLECLFMRFFKPQGEKKTTFSYNQMQSWWRALPRYFPTQIWWCIAGVPIISRKATFKIIQCTIYLETGG